MRQFALALLLLLTAAVLVVALYRPTLTYGFDYDDYHFVHPYSHADVAAAFHGPWDPAGIERPYYRPLTIALYASRFEALGINATAHHALSLILFAVAATLAGVFALRLTSSLLFGFLTTVIYTVHPAMPYSLVAWVTNQMHLMESIVVLAALIWWDAVHTRRFVWWIPLFGFAVAAFLIKEDGIMLLPSIFVLHVIRAWLGSQRVAHIPKAFVAISVVLVVGLLALRSTALAHVSSPKTPSASAAIHNYFHGLNGLARLVPADRPWQMPASWFVTLAPLAAFVMWRRLSREARVALVSGIALALLFNLPFVFITKAEQMHLVAFGIVLLVAAACAGLLQLPRHASAKGVLAMGCAAGIACLAVVSRDIARDFEPYGPVVLAHDEMVRGWAAVPVELRNYLARKPSSITSRTLSPDPSLALDVVSFGTHLTERSPDGVVYRWMSGSRVEILIRDGTRKVLIPLRHAIEVFREPARVRITIDGRVVDEMTLGTSEWRISTATMPSHAPRLARMHRLVVAIDHAWRPMDIIPGSHDDRVLGLQVGELQLR